MFAIKANALKAGDTYSTDNGKTWTQVLSQPILTSNGAVLITTSEKKRVWEYADTNVIVQ